MEQTGKYEQLKPEERVAIASPKLQGKGSGSPIGRLRQ